MADNRDENSELLAELISTVQKKNDKEKVDDSVKSKQARVIAVDDETYKVFVYFLDDIEEKEYTFYNKTGEIINVGDTVKVFYTSNPAKGWIGSKSGQPSASTVTEQNPLYISAKVQNQTSVSYDKIERGVLSVDFTVEGTDSDVVFTANQKCNVKSEGDVTTIYRVDGGTQDFKLVETLSPGKRVMSHIYPMTLNIGKHNFAVYMMSENGGKGNVAIGDIIGALSGQISGLRENTPPNDNLIFYYTGLPTGELTLPANIIAGSNTKKYVDWGDGSDVEESVGNTSVTHTYASDGDYVITIKTDGLNFGIVNPAAKIVATGFENYLTRVYFPDNAKVIRFSGTSQNTPNLETLVFGNSATTITWYFGSNNNLTSLLLPDTLVELYLSAFDKTKVISLIIPKSVTTFSSGLTSPSTLKTLERYDSAKVNINRATGLETLTIGGNATQTNTYIDATSLKKVIFPLPTKLTSITGGAFSGCSSLSNITIPNGVTEMGANAFKECSSLTNIVLPDTLTSVGQSAFEQCSSLVNIILPSKVTAIADATFRFCYSLTSADLKGIKSISPNAFYNDSKLSAVNLTEGLTSIGDAAFSGCNSISNITFPSTLKIIGTSAFSVGIASNISFSPGMSAEFSYLGYRAFYQSGITEFRISPTTTLDDSGYQFYGCKYLNNLIIEEGTTTIPIYCFTNTTSLSDLIVPSSITSIGKFSFKNSTVNPSFSPVINSLIIGVSAFENCGITNAIIPDNTTTIGSSAFQTCSKLTAVKINGNPTCGSSAFWGCTALLTADISNLKNISANMFSKCSELHIVHFSTGVTIGNSAFSGCNLTDVDILNIVSTGGLTDDGGEYNVGGHAFSDNKRLTNVSGYKYKWDIYDKAVHTQRDKNGNVTEMWYAYSKTSVNGIYNAMKAISDSVFSGTGLKTASDFPKDKLAPNEEHHYEDGSSYIVVHYAYDNTSRTEPQTEYIIP